MFKKSLLACAASALMIVGAQAADVIEPTAYDWTGPYIGLQGGYAWGENDADADLPILGLARSSEPVILDPHDDGSIGIDGFVGGAHTGYNWQSDSFVFGIEGDVEFADMDGDTDVFVQEGDEVPSGSIGQEIDWLASLRLRAGFAVDRALIYATGGLAVGGVELELVAPDSEVDDSETDTAWGWTVGGGLEYAFTDDLSARIEYRYTDLGDTGLSVAPLGFINAAEFESTFHAVRAGLSWHFNSM